MQFLARSGDEWSRGDKKKREHKDDPQISSLNSCLMKPFTVWPTFDQDLRGRFKLSLLFLLVTGLQGREDAGPVLREMPAYGLHHSATRGTDHDAKGVCGQLKLRGLPTTTVWFPIWDIFFKEEGLSLGQY